MSKPGTFTVLESNEALRTARFVGTFATESDADAYARQQASRSRTFATFQVHENRGGTMVRIAAPAIRGEK